MDLQIWAASRLGRIEFSLRRRVKFYAPLTDSLDFMGVDPVTLTRASAAGRVGRDGQSYTVAANVPSFNYLAGFVDQAVGMAMLSGQTLQYSGENQLNDSNTLLWWSNLVPQSTPTNAPIFSSAGIYTGPLGINLKDVIKFDSVLSNAQINAVQVAIADVAQVIPPPTPPVTIPTGAFVVETPSGAANSVNKTFTLSSTPQANSLILTYSGLTLKQVPSAPGEMEFSLSGTTITMGLAPAAGYAFQSHYVV